MQSSELDNKVVDKVSKVELCLTHFCHFNVCFIRKLAEHRQHMKHSENPLVELVRLKKEAKMESKALC